MMYSDAFISAVFCPPTGAWEGVPDRLSDSVFQTLKEIGVNRIFAYGMDDRPETVERTFRQCEKYQIPALRTGFQGIPAYTSGRQWGEALECADGRGEGCAG